jgi:hypothetical protein
MEGDSFSDKLQNAAGDAADWVKEKIGMGVTSKSLEGQNR